MSLLKKDDEEIKTKNLISSGSVIIKPDTNLSIQNLQTYATNALAITGGLSVDDIYKTATGELRIVV